MKWLEIINLRISDINRVWLKSQLQELIKAVSRDKEQQAIKAYFHATIDTDFSIHLLHDSEMMQKGGSRLGLRLASALRDFGLVDHSIWIEGDGK